MAGEALYQTTKHLCSLFLVQLMRSNVTTIIVCFLTVDWFSLLTPVSDINLLSFNDGQLSLSWS